MELKLYNGTTSLLDLTTGAYNIERFDPGTPEHRDERVASVFQHGEEVLYVRHKNVVATLVLLVLGSTAAVCDTAVEAISSILADIIASRGTAGEPFYIRFGPQGSTSYDSELYSARLIQSDNRAQEPYDRASKMGTTDSYFRKVTIIFERAPWWQATTLTELSLSNGHGSGTGGIEVRNSNDVSNDNYAQITGSAVLGTERTPLKLFVQRNQAGTDSLRTVYISRNGRFTPNSTPTVIEVGDAAAFLGSHTNVVDTKYSDGNGDRWNPAPTSYGASLCYGSIAAADLQYYRGRWFHILLTVDNLSANDTLRVRFALQQGDTYELTSTEWYDITKDGVHDIGAIKIPPQYLGDIDHWGKQWRLRGYDPNNSSVDVTLDAIHLMPSEPEDGFMVGEAWGASLTQGWGYMFEGDRRIVYMSYPTGPYNFTFMTKISKFIEVVPGDDCRLLFAWDTFNSGAVPVFASADETYTVQAWYRKRILHI